MPWDRERGKEREREKREGDREREWEGEKREREKREWEEGEGERRWRNRKEGEREGEREREREWDCLFTAHQTAGLVIILLYLVFFTIWTVSLKWKCDAIWNDVCRSTGELALRQWKTSTDQILSLWLTTLRCIPGSTCILRCRGGRRLRSGTGISAGTRCRRRPPRTGPRSASPGTPASRRRRRWWGCTARRSGTGTGCCSGDPSGYCHRLEDKERGHVILKGRMGTSCSTILPH